MDKKCTKVGWDKLDTDILVRIFRNNFSIGELTTSGVAHVCSAWRVACCDPTLWHTLDLSQMKSTFIKIQNEPYVYVERCSDQELTRILKISMSLSKGNTTTLLFHFNLFLSDDMFTYTLERCPNLRRLVLPAWNRLKETSICNAISLCKNLESLTMPSMPNPEPRMPSMPDLKSPTMSTMSNPYFVFSSIQKNCKKFRELKVMGPIELFFVQKLVELFPKLEVLSLRCNAIHPDTLIKILDNMKSLEVLNISHSYITEMPETKVVEWSTIVEKASKLKRFMICLEPFETCVMCQRTIEDEGMMRWYKYEEGLWKADEISSLDL